MKLLPFSTRIKLFSAFTTTAFVCFLSGSAFSQGSVVVQPGAPGQPTKVLPSTTRAKLPPTSPKDVEFMQGMIHHHAQAVEMTDLIESRTENKDIRLLGARISKSQLDEMNFMKRWLEVRGESTEMTPHSGSGTDAHGGHYAKPPEGGTQNRPPAGGAQDASDHQMLMPGMLTAKQMEALRKATGAEFDRLFLEGMIQHHNGAVVMVRELFDTAGAGQDAELFNFANDVDTGQRAEIKSMQTLLAARP